MPSKPLRAHRYGTLMAPLPASPHEGGGVCNPGGVTGPDQQFYLFPRLVAAGNYSRIGLARVTRHPDGRPAGVQRLGVALQPSETYDAAGCEDARVVYAPTLHVYVMTYTGLGADAIPRICVAFSTDLRSWSKAGPVQLQPLVLDSLLGRAAVDLGQPQRVDDIATVPNKDGVFLPEPVVAPDGRLSWALLHRPMFRFQPGRPLAIYLSYCPTTDLASGRAVFGQHRVVLAPKEPWEADRMGAGCVLATETGWLLIYHGVQARSIKDEAGAGYQTTRTYRAGMALLDKTAPHKVLSRTTQPILEPRTKHELEGVVNNVVFPTAAQVRTHKGTPGLDIYYGMADRAIGCARFDLETPAPPPSPKPATMRDAVAAYGQRRYGAWGTPAFRPSFGSTPYFMRGLIR